jgi:hypothetical protein
MPFKEPAEDLKSHLGLFESVDRDSPLGLYETVPGFGRALTRKSDVLGPLVAQLQDLAELQDAEIVAILAAISALSSLFTNMEIPIIPSGAYTSTQTSPDLVNDGFKRLLLVLNVSNNIGAINLVPSLQVKDSISGNYKTVWTALKPITTKDTFTYYFADGTNGGQFTESKGFGLPAKTWRVVVTPGNGNNITYSVSGALLT